MQCSFREQVFDVSCGIRETNLNDEMYFFFKRSPMYYKRLKFITAWFLKMKLKTCDL